MSSLVSTIHKKMLATGWLVFTHAWFLHTGALQARKRKPGTFDQGDGEMTLNPQDEPTINLPFKYASHNLGKRLQIVQHSLAVVLYSAGTQNLKLEGEV